MATARSASIAWASLLSLALSGSFTGCGEPPTGAPPSTAVEPSAPEASTDPGIRERNIVRKKLPKGLKSIAIEYTVILVDDDGNEKTVDPAEHTFKVGDSFLVRIRPQDDLYVYVFNEGPGGQRVCLLPSSDEKPQRVRAGTDVALPQDGGYFTFEPPAGEEKLVVVALPEPTDDLRLLATSVFKAQSAGLRSNEASEAKKEADAAIEALREKSGAAVRTRGPVRKVIERLDGGVGQGASVAFVEPPIDGESSSYGIAIAAGDADGPQLVLDIPLRSRGAENPSDRK